MFKSALAKFVAAKLLLAGAASAALGGVALAATSDSLPGPLQQAVQSAAPAETSSSASDTLSESVAPSETPTSSDPASTDPASSEPASASTSASASETGGPHPSLVGLCHAYQAGATSNPGKALQNPAFTVLVTTAGGVDNVAAYCDALIGPRPSHPAGKPSTHPGNGHRSSSEVPSTAPSDVPTVESSAPASQPTGKGGGHGHGRR